MSRRMILIFGVSVLVFGLWAYLEGTRLQERGEAQRQALSGSHTVQDTQTGDLVQTSQAQTQAKPAPVEKVPTGPDFLLLDLATSQAEVHNGTTLFKDWELKGYRAQLESEAEGGESQPVRVSSVTRIPTQVQFAFDHPDYAYLDKVRGNLTQSGETVTWVYEDEKIKLTRVSQINSEQPVVDVNIRAQFKTLKPKYAFVSISSEGRDDAEAMDRNLNYFTSQEMISENASDEREVEAIATPLRWIAAVNRYFGLTVLARGSFLPNGVLQPLNNGIGGRLSMVYPITGDSLEVPLSVYFGAKDLTTLRAIEPTLDHMVDLGWFTFLAYPMLKLLKWFYSFFQNYGVAILLLTLLVKIVTYPLTYKSMVGMRKMAELQPEVAKLQKKYKGDREALNREMMHFMKNRGYNPMAGCWPVLIQMPIFLALYQVLYNAVELYQAPFGFWLHDLSQKDPYYVMPVLVSLTWFLQQKMTPNTISDPTQRKIMQAMPIMFGLFMITLPSGLGLYFFANAVLSIFQQMLLNKKLGPMPAMSGVMNAKPAAPKPNGA